MSNRTSIELEDQIEIQTQKSVRCKNCGHEVTSPALAIQPHEHTFRNPMGYSFHVVCYSDAPGALDIGDATTADSWFPTYAWTFAVCFAGLIATRLMR